jgi:hypothetical protein
MLVNFGVLQAFEAGVDGVCLHQREGGRIFRKGAWKKHHSSMAVPGLSDKLTGRARVGNTDELPTLARASKTIFRTFGNVVSKASSPASSSCHHNMSTLSCRKIEPRCSCAKNLTIRLSTLEPARFTNKLKISRGIHVESQDCSKLPNPRSRSLCIQVSRHFSHVSLFLYCCLRQIVSPTLRYKLMMIFQTPTGKPKKFPPAVQEHTFASQR